MIEEFNAPSPARPEPDDGSDAAHPGPLLDWLEGFAGLRLDARQRQGLSRVLAVRLQARELTRLDDYQALLADDADELAALLGGLESGRRGLFEDPVLVAGLEPYLTALVQQQPEPRVWIADGQDGDDAWALALLLAEAQLALEAPIAFSVIVTGLAPEPLALARRGRVGAGFAAALPATLASRYLILDHEGAAIAPELRTPCSFLAIADAPSGEGFDLIDARQHLAGLAPAQQRPLLEAWHARLRPGGLLLLDRAESIALHADRFEPLPGVAGLYRRGETAADGSAQFQAYRAALVASTTPAAVLDGTGCFLEANPTLLQLAGCEAGDLAGLPLIRLLGDADHDAAQRALATLAIGESLQFDVTLNTRLAPLPARLKLSAGLDAGVPVLLAEWGLATQPALIESSRGGLVDTGLALMNEGVIVIDTDGRIREFNSRAGQLTGWTREQALGLEYAHLLRLSDADGVAADPLARCLVDRHGVERNRRYTLLTRDGRRLTLNASCSALVENHRITGALLLIEDQTQQTLLAGELDYRSTHDAVTGLLNRSEFDRRMGVALDEAHRSGRPQLLCYVDVDQFKVINDTLGHYAGDELLRQLATLLRARLRPQDSLARLGGDEFGVLLTGVDRDEGTAVVDSLIEAVRAHRFEWADLMHAVTVSIGVAEMHEASADIVSVFADADAACYAAKDAGRDRARWVADGADDIRRRHAEMTMVGRIGKALDEGRFLLYYEDVVGATDASRVYYRELLVRMRGDDGRLIQPADFIAAAERYYLMSALDRWIIDKAFDGIARLPEDEVIYAINVSGMSLSDDQFLAHVIDSLQRSGVAPRRICFEITETSAITHLSEAVRFISQLADRGCRFALDDFGAGMSSFGYLRNLPVQFVKIDGSFVRSMQASTADRSMVEAMNRVGHDMGLRTIAEHVEDHQSLAMLAAIGVDWVQGKVIGEGQPFDALLARVGR